MVVDAQRLPIEALADAAGQVAAAGDLRTALAVLADAAATDADLAVLRVLDDGGELVARAVAPEASAVAAETAGTRTSSDRIADGLPSEAVAQAVEAVAAGGVLVEAARAGGRLVGSLELVRAQPFGETERAVAQLVAAQLAHAVAGCARSRPRAPRGVARPGRRSARRGRRSAAGCAAGGSHRRRRDRCA